MRRNLGVIFLAATLGLVLIPTSARGASDVYRFRGQTAHASFANATGCIHNVVEIDYDEEVSQITVVFSRYDACRHVYIHDAYGYSNSNVLADSSISSGLRSAHLRASLEVRDRMTNSRLPLTLDIEWTGIGEAFRSSEKRTTATANYRFVHWMRGTTREAGAVGTFLLGAETLPLTSAWEASLATAEEGYTTICRGDVSFPVSCS